MYQQNVELEIRVNGRAVRTYNHEDKVFAESREGSEYTIHVKNNNWFKVLVVPSIDGISTMNGKKASHDSGGYIVGAYQTYEIKGFRKDFDTVGAFKFTKKSAGYAASKGDTRNVGIISVAIFKEKQPNYIYNNSVIFSGGHFSQSSSKPYIDYSYTTCNNKFEHEGSPCLNDMRGLNIQAQGLSLSATSNVDNGHKMMAFYSTPVKDTFDHSTNWGNKLNDKVISGTFERESLLVQFDVYYASKEGLKTLGIDVVPKKEVAFPQGFDNTFCKPPKNW